MTVIETKVKRWGNSFGVVIPIEIIEEEKIKENDSLKLIVLKDSKNAFKETFGMGKGKIKKSAQQIKDELRRDLYN
ncbi:AbrB/MazE/SpoVT family DNA-binding domain-containing protein [Candidatus Pacearchaeota archaeon]|nr:AbrB/MazE/SpoVT family DNA-binding domain-containing protein [Candidatus Pacearchaeota archaeon]